MANWTTPRTWPDAYLVGASDLNQQVRDNLTALYDAQHDVVTRVQFNTTTYNMVSSGAGAELFASDLSWTADGSSYVVEFFCAKATATTASATIVLTDGNGTIITPLAQISAGSIVPVFAKYYYTPISGSRALNVVGVFGTGGSGTIVGANGGPNTNDTSFPPAYLRITGTPI